MAKKKTLITMLADNCISFDLIENEKGKKVYETEFLSFEADNTDEYAKTGNFSGVNIYGFMPDSIPYFDKVCGDASVWKYIVPIEKIDVSDITEKQLDALLGQIGAELKSLALNCNLFTKLELNKIVKACPKLCELELTDGNWEREKRMTIDLNDIGKQKFDVINCQQFSIKNGANWSALNISSLTFDDCDTSKVYFPDKLKELSLTSINDVVTIQGAKNLNQLKLVANAESSKSVDLSSLSSLAELELSLMFAEKVKVKLPAALKSLDLNASIENSFSLAFLKDLKNLESLKIRTGEKSAKDINAISSLSNLKQLKYDENGVGNDSFKSDFKTEYLKGLKQLEELSLRYVVNLPDFSFVKELPALKVLEIDTSRVKTLKGLEAGNVEKLSLSDCHSISDWTPILKSKITDLKFFISGYWGTKLEMTTKTLNQLAESSIKNAEISLDKVKLTKKDLKPMEKVFTLDGDSSSMTFERK